MSGFFEILGFQKLREQLSIAFYYKKIGNPSEINFSNFDHYPLMIILPPGKITLKHAQNQFAPVINLKK